MTSEPPWCTLKSITYYQIIGITDLFHVSKPSFILLSYLLQHFLQLISKLQYLSLSVIFQLRLLGARIKYEDLQWIRFSSRNFLMEPRNHRNNLEHCESIIYISLINYTISVEKWNYLMFELADDSNYFECSWGINSSFNPWITSKGHTVFLIFSTLKNLS